MDFDHWNFPTHNLQVNVIVGVATLDFDHWNYLVVDLKLSGKVGVATLDFDHWNPSCLNQSGKVSRWSSYFGFRSLERINTMV